MGGYLSMGKRDGDGGVGIKKVNIPPSRIRD